MYNVLAIKILFILIEFIVLHPISLNGEIQSKGTDTGANFGSQYPNLYFSAKDLPKLRAQAKSSHAEIYKELRETVRSQNKAIPPPEDESVFKSEWNEKYGNMLGRLAIYCALTPDDHEAINLAKLFMKRLTSYGSWLVTGRESDEIPFAHSLLGYATAFDCLHDSFTQEERDRYAMKLLWAGSFMFDAANEVWWGQSYIHNHVATNYMALLTAAIVVKPYYPYKALLWEDKSVSALNATMEFLKLVVDGSFQEGVSYGTYTMRSLTQFMYISERHFATGYRTNNWLWEHFDFLMYTIIPGFQLTVGFADSNPDWAYGPESQIEFLENYLYKDGRAAWLSSEIKRHKSKRFVSMSLAHTEFLFHNSSLKAKRSSEVKLHVFSDWGVLIYGGGIPEPHVFLSFKCSHLHGRAINLLRPSLDPLTQRGFVPGHEHPDQGSFVFVAKDQPVVTESRYGPKYTYLQNTLMFGPSNKGCGRPYLGQFGECYMWFNHRNGPTWFPRADLVGYSRENDVIFMSGEMTQVYDGDLGLGTVYRALIMPTSNVLLVVDIVRFRSDSTTTHASAFFHNSDFVFNVEAYDKEKNHCVGIGRYKMCWEHLNAQTVNVGIANNVKVSTKKHTTNYVNVTWKRAELLTSTAYVFHGPQHTLRDFKLSETKNNGININLKLNSLKYQIVLSSKHDNPRLRRKLLGSNGYGKMHVKSADSSSTFHLGVKTSSTVSVSKANDVSKTSEISVSKFKKDSFSVRFAVIFVMLMLWYFNRKIRLRLWKRLAAFCVLLLGLAIYMYAASSYGRLELNPFPANSSGHNLVAWKSNLPDAVLINGLPSSGVELARELFTTNLDYVTIDVPPELKDVGENMDLREWTKKEVLGQNFNIWWKTVLKTPTKLKYSNEFISLANPLNLSDTPKTFIRKPPGAFPAICLKNPGWLFKMSALFDNRQVTLLYVIRDPRSWIEHMLMRPNTTDLFLKDFKTAIHKTDCVFSNEIQHLRELNIITLERYIALAHIWNAFTSYALRLRSILPRGGLRIVRFEDLMTSPKATADDVYSFLEMPFSAAVEHRIVQITRSGLYKFANYGIVEPSLCKWGKHLTEPQVARIYGICKKAMKNIVYS